MDMVRIAAGWNGITAWQVALVELIGASLVIVAAWIFEVFGYQPCELCLKERTPYYAAIPLAALLVWLTSGRGRFSLALAGFVGLAIIFAASSIFGLYHAGVEWGWFAGPTECTGTYKAPAAVTDFLQQLYKVQVVRCDEPSLYILGLTLAAWNGLISASLAALAIVGARLSQGSSSVSQYK
jgi:disulfide bond formation protein DsbB